MVAFIHHVDLGQVQHDEIVMQFASAIFAALHIRFQIVAEERDLQLQRARLWPFRNERAVDFVVVTQRHSQRSNFFGLHMRQVVVEPAAPFLAIADEGRRVN